MGFSVREIRFGCWISERSRRSKQGAGTRRRSKGRGRRRTIPEGEEDWDEGVQEEEEAGDALPAA